MDMHWGFCDFVCHIDAWLHSLVERLPKKQESDGKRYYTVNHPFSEFDNCFGHLVLDWFSVFAGSSFNITK